MNKKLIRITTVPISLQLLLTGQMKFMKARGYEVIMVSSVGKELQDVIKNEGCVHHIIPFTRKISPFQDLKCLFQLIKLIKKEKPDIIHTHTPKAGLLGMLAGRICRVKLKIHTIAGLPLMTATGGKRKLLEGIEKLTYWAADYVLPNSNSMMSFVKKYKYTKAYKLDMIGRGSSNGIDLMQFSREMIKAEVLSEVKASINYEAKNKYILAIGRMVKDKGIIELIDAFLEIKQEYKDLKLLLIGPLEKERKEELLPPTILNAIKNDNDIHHINWSDNVAYYMYLADILVHASYREGFPNVLLQAGAMQCPVICSEISGNIDIVTDKKTGLYFLKGNTTELIKRIDFALKEEGFMQKNALKLRKEIEANFSRKYVHQELLKFYEAKRSEQK